MRTRTVPLVYSMLAAILTCAPATGAFAAIEARSEPPRQTSPSADFDSQYKQGEEFYRAKQYADAIQCFQRALAIKSDPNVLYNIAQSHRKLGHHREAKEYFEWFLRIPSDISAAERQSVEDIIAELGEKIRREEAAKLVYVQEASPRRPPPPWRIAMGIVGIAGGVTMLAFGGLAASIDGKPYLDSNGKENLQKIYSTNGLAAGLLTPGALLLVGGVILLAVPSQKNTSKDGIREFPKTTTVSMGLVGSGPGVMLRGSY